MFQNQGHTAEAAAANFLRSRGYVVIATNWRTRFVEIDIVAIKKRTDNIYFFEVKYRKNLNQGEGYDYVEAQKLMRMRHGAESYMFEERPKQSQPSLGVVSVGGSSFSEIEIYHIDF